ncbi:MAG TPA: Nudix family hydrolase [Rhodanobacteraceae bacterium]
MLRVAAGVLVDADGRVLLAERPPGKQLAGFREFPGGKLEAGESVVEALRRELREELAIDAEVIDPLPLIEVPWRHGDVELRLIAHRVRAWQGTPRSCEGQALDWHVPAQIDPAALAPADRHILHAVRLPRHYPVTPDVPADTPVANIQALLHAAVDAGETLLQLRLPTWPMEAVRELAAGCLPWLRAAGVSLLLNGDIEGALQLGIGVHLRAAQLAALSDRPLPQGQWVGASCHTLDELQKAQAIGADFVVLSPVKSTPTHPAAVTLGWVQLEQLISVTPLPVYALGGVGPDDLDCALASGAQGVAGIRAFWSHVSDR